VTPFEGKKKRRKKLQSPHSLRKARISTLNRFGVVREGY
jgi:hypothetical protein